MEKFVKKQKQKKTFKSVSYLFFVTWTFVNFKYILVYKCADVRWEVARHGLIIKVTSAERHLHRREPITEIKDKLAQPCPASNNISGREQIVALNQKTREWHHFYWHASWLTSTLDSVENTQPPKNGNQKLLWPDRSTKLMQPSVKVKRRTIRSSTCWLSISQQVQVERSAIYHPKKMQLQWKSLQPKHRTTGYKELTRVKNDYCKDRRYLFILVFKRPKL